VLNAHLFESIAELRPPPDATIERVGRRHRLKRRQRDLAGPRPGARPLGGAGRLLDLSFGAGAMLADQPSLERRPSRTLSMTAVLHRQGAVARWLH